MRGCTERVGEQDISRSGSYRDISNDPCAANWLPHEWQSGRSQLDCHTNVCWCWLTHALIFRMLPFFKISSTLAHSMMQDTDRPHLRQLRKHGRDGVHMSSVIVTVREGESFDELFAKCPQCSQDGTFAEVYEANGAGLGVVLKALRGDLCSPADKLPITELLSDMSAVDPVSVLFNFECCAGYWDIFLSFPWDIFLSPRPWDIFLSFRLVAKQLSANCQSAFG